MELLNQLKEDFKEYKHSCRGIILFGSYATEDFTKRSDIDVCIVNPKNRNVYFEILKKLGGKYDLKIFEELPLYIQINLIKNFKGNVIYGDELELSEYFYKFRKLWKDMEHRIKENTFSSVREKIFLRRKFNEYLKESQ
jgi:predicted nucleotidyltransferase